MKNKRILTIQDVSCVGQCSLTVALPIISACGVETAILPSAVLSTHTAGFKGFTFTDLTDDIPGIEAHWNREGILFDALYTGYLGSEKQIGYVRSIRRTTLKPGAPFIVDPAMGDNGKLYPAFDAQYARSMAGLCGEADIILPNLTEASFMTGIPYRETYDEAYVLEVMQALTRLGARSVVLTGVGYTPETTGVAVFENGQMSYYCHPRFAKGCHGTGDIYSSAFTGAYMRGKSLYDAARIAADFTYRAIANTQDDPDHWYGAEFEPVLKDLIRELDG